MHKLLSKMATVLFSVIILCSLLILIYSVFRIVRLSPDSSRIIENSYTYYFYIIAALLGMVLGFFSFKLSEDTRINLAILSVSIFSCSYLAEAFLLTSYLLTERAKSAPFRRAMLGRAKLAKKSGIAFDTRTPLEVYFDLRKADPTAFPFVSPASFLKSKEMNVKNLPLSPLGGASQKTTIYCNESGSYVIYDSDEHGFNNSYGIFSQPVDLLLIGDSFTQGACVDPGQNINGHLRKYGQNSINLGMASNGPLLELATLTEYGPSLKPGIVLWLYFEGNDLIDLERENVPFFLQYLTPHFSQHLLDRQSEIDSIIYEYVKYKEAEFSEKSQAKCKTPDTEDMKNTEAESIEEAQAKRKALVIQFVKLWHLRTRLGIAPSLSKEPSLTQISGTDTDETIAAETFEQIMKHAKEVTASWQGTLYFVYLPAWHRYAQKDIDKEVQYHRGTVMSIIQDLDIPIIDIHESFTNHSDPLSLFPLRIGGHYTAEGYQLTAQKILTVLENKKTAKR